MHGEAVMMWEKQELAFFQSIEGGCHTEEEAQAKWNELVAKADGPNVIKDKKGPAIKPPFRNQKPGPREQCKHNAEEAVDGL